MRSSSMAAAGWLGRGVPCNGSPSAAEMVVLATLGPSADMSIAVNRRHGVYGIGLCAAQCHQRPQMRCPCMACVCVLHSQFFLIHKGDTVKAFFDSLSVFEEGLLLCRSVVAAV